MRVSVLFWLLCFSAGLFAQQLDKTVEDFGKVNLWNNPEAVFVLTNTSGKDIIFLPTAYEHHLGVQFEKSRLEPGESSAVYVRYYTEKPGKFVQDVEFYINTQNEPFVVTLVGNIRSFHPEALTICPMIEPPQAVSVLTGHRLLVLDSETGKGLSDYSIEIENHSGTENFKSMRPEYELRNLKPDLYRIKVTKDGFSSEEITLYINRRSSKTTIALERRPTFEYIPAEQPELEETQDEEIRDTIIIAEVIEPDLTDSLPIVLTTPFEEKDSSDLIGGELNESKYKFNHLIFLIDVSSSMDRDEKLPLLKYSMYEMIKVLRDEDKVSIITYSSKVNTLVTAISGSGKDVLNEVIFNLHAKGQSYGSEGIEEAYALAAAHFISGGNNEIILASDGIFNSSDFSERKLYRKIRGEQKNMAIRFSSIAFGNSPAALDFLRNLSLEGDGAFIRIPDREVAETILINTIMSHSLKEAEADWFITE